MAVRAEIEDVIEFIRVSQRIDPRKAVAADSLIADDLGVSGGKGAQLLWELQERFGVSFVGADRTVREAFGLAADESLFVRDAGDPEAFLAGLLGTDPTKVRPLSVARLHEVILALQTGCKAGDASVD